jgi:iron complex outermembrane recepter protein
MRNSLNWTARSALLGVAAALVTFTLPDPAIAQSKATDKPLEEITVTARRREESLQDVPIAVSAYTGKTLDEFGVVDVTALSNYTPNVTLEVSRATNTTLTAYIRGIGQQDPVAGWEGGVGIYLDDVYLARPQATVFDIYDVERIEILRGPQGTLYGRNTIGGAVRYVTKPLATEKELSIRANVGDYSQADLILTGNLPISDTFRIGGTVATFNHDGWGKNQYTGEDNADKQIMGYRATAEWEPSSDVFVRLFGDYSVDDSTPRQGARMLPSATIDPVTGDVYPVLSNPFDTRAGISTYPSSTGGLHPQVTQGGVGLLVKWNISDALELKSITSNRSDHSESLIDFDNLPIDEFDAPVVYDNSQFSQEFQLTYTSGPLTGVFGLYYLDANAFDAFDVVLGTSGVTAFTLGDYDTKAWAPFLDVTYDLNDQWSLSVGGRYTEDERTARVYRETYLGLGSPYFGNDGAISITVPTEGVPEFDGNRTDNKFTPRVSLAYSPTDNQNLYISYSEGFKGGGFDPRGAYNYAEVRAGFAPESVKQIELGAKSVWAGGRFTTNIAAFTMDYTDVQIPGSILLDANGDGVVDGFAGKVTNAGKANVDGLEVEAAARFTDDFSATFSLGLINADYTEWLQASTDPNTGETSFVDISNQREFQNTPDKTANLTLRYETTLGPGSLAVIGSVSYKGDSYQFEVPDPLVDQQTFSLYDLSLVWTSDSGRYQAALYGRNLADKEYIVASYEFGAVDNSVIGFYGPPRTITGSFTVNFK